MKKLKSENRLSKKESFKLLLELREDIENLIDESLSPERRIEEFKANFPHIERQLDSLFLYFCDKPAKKAKTPFEWVSLAAAKKTEIRTYLQYVYCDGEHIMASDGRVLFVADNLNGLEEGYYLPGKTPIQTEYHDVNKWPDSIVNRMMKPSDFPNWHTMDEWPLELEQYPKGNDPDDQYIFYRLSDKLGCQKSLFDLVSVASIQRWSIGKNGNIMFETDFGKAVVGKFNCEKKD